MPKNSLPMAIWIAIPAALLMMPCPEGLKPEAWTMLAFYVMAILGMILRPIAEPAALLVTIGIYSLLFGGTAVSASVAGYGSGTVWLVFSACLVSRAFVETGLGRRMAYLLIDRFGRTPLGLGYVAAFADLIIAPATPSNTARSGGIIYPILRSIAVTLGSEPGPTAKKIGSYLSLVSNGVSLSTASMFLTSSAPILLVFSFGKDVLGVEISWGTYALAAFPPCFIFMMLVPYLYYRITPPEIKVIDNKNIAKAGLAELGPITRQEKTLLGLFVFALAAWATSNWTGINNTAVALAFVGGTLLFNVTSWDAMLKEKNAWNTFIWYGAILGLAGGLSRLGFFKWLGEIVVTYVNFSGLGPCTVMALLIFSSLPLRYVFASAAAYVGTMIPVYMMLAQAGAVPPMLAAVSLASTIILGSFVTHFAQGASTVIYAGGYVDQKTWWGTGAFVAPLANVIVLALGFPWWKMIGIW